MENIREGKEVDIGAIPTPVWHEHDGGAFIGTACMVVMKDPDSGWINYGAYRIQSQGPDVATVMMSPGKHGRIMMSKYHDRKQPCPVAVVVGMHPALFMLAGLEIPYGKSEFEAAGGILGEPVEVVQHAEDRPAGAGQCGDRLRGFHSSRRHDPGRPARRMDRLLRRRHAGRSPRSASRP